MTDILTRRVTFSQPYPSASFRTDWYSCKTQAETPQRGRDGVGIEFSFLKVKNHIYKRRPQQMRSGGESQTGTQDQDSLTAARLPWSSKPAPDPAHFPAGLSLPQECPQDPRPQRQCFSHAGDLTELRVLRAQGRSYGFSLIINQLNRLVI